VGSSDIERVNEFEHRFARAQATDVVDLSWGYAVLQREFPFSHWHNRIAITSDVPAAEVLATADEVLGGAGMRHRYLSADAQGKNLIADFVAAGYEHESIVTMIYAGPEVEPAPHEVRAVSLDTLRPAIIRDWRETLPDASDEELAQLADRTALSARGAELTLLAVYDGDDIAAHADLYIDRGDRLTQFENLATDENFRRRGYGDALVRDALRRGWEAGCDLSFLTADLGGWPRTWYQRLGYVDAGLTHHFNRREE
jgi:GNAT superfamily N-acetyltransferase